MANMYINSMTALWNSAGTNYAAIKMNVTNAASSAASMLLQLQTGSVDKFYVDKNGNATMAGALTSVGVTSSAALRPSANDSAALGISDTSWSDLYLASGGVINWNAGDVTITHSANTLAFGGAGSGYLFDGVVKPSANDNAALGASGTAWSDLFLASGSVIDFNAGDVTLTHAADFLTVGGGDLRVTTAGAAATSVVTVGGSQTLTGKTLTSPAITTPAITGPGTWSGGGTLGGTFTGGTFASATLTAPTITSPTVSNPTITGTASMGIISASGAISGSTISAATTITGTTITASGTSSANILSAISAITSGGNVTANASFVSASTGVILATASAGTVYLRPNGYNSVTAQATLELNGNFSATLLRMAGQLATNTAIFNKPSNGNYTIISYGPPSAGAMIGYSHDTAHYGILGYYVGGVNSWSFYGSGAAFNTQVWTASDARVKHDIADCDCHDAYNKVRSIPVKSYRKDDSIERSGAAYDEMGWLAHEVEAAIPEAVVDVLIPEQDTDMRARMGDTIKATNDRTLLATLWAAVQHQADMIERMERKLTALEGAN
jgi:Chaperone of endosialidase